MPVSVIVEKTRATTPSWVANTGFLTDICKGPIAVVAVENIDTKIGHIKIYIAIVVVIRTSGSLSVVAAVSHACDRCNVSKGAITVVPIERAGCFIC